MTIKDVVEAVRLTLIHQLYDEWNCEYIVMQLRDGCYREAQTLSKDEAIAYRCKPDEALRIKWPETPIGAGA